MKKRYKKGIYIIRWKEEKTNLILYDFLTVRQGMALGTRIKNRTLNR